MLATDGNRLCQMTMRPSDVFGPPDGRKPLPAPADDDTQRRRRGPQWPVLAGAAVLAVVIAGLVAAPSEIGESGVPPAVVDVVSEDQAIAALALYRAQAETYQALAVERSLYTPPGPGPIVQAAEQGLVLVRQRLEEARQHTDADPAASRYWTSADHDALLQRLESAQRDIGEANLLALIHDSVYDGAGSVPLDRAELELASRYATGTADRDGPLLPWGRALLGEFEGLDGRAAAEQARANVDPWWSERVETLRPVAGEPLLAYLGGLPPSTVRGLEGHPLAGPGLELLRAQG
jgi:hypothetical protein